MSAQTEPANACSIMRAAEILRRGGLVAMPTETVYGLAADAASDAAIAAVFAAKERPRINPLIVHVRDLAHADEIADFPPEARVLAQTFWPGPLTLVLPRKPNARVSLLAGAGLDTIALRVPAHDVAQGVLRKSGLALAAPSANRSGQVSPTQAFHVVQGLGNAVELVLDGGPARCGVESTIVGFDSGKVLLLRPGALARECIEGMVGKLQAPQSGSITSPGQLRSHYAPATPLRLHAAEARPDEALLAFGATLPPHSGPVRNLSPTGDVCEAAANLFSMLRELDSLGCAQIAVMDVPELGLGEAINDRLQRAAAPRAG